MFWIIMTIMTTTRSRRIRSRRRWRRRRGRGAVPGVQWRWWPERMKTTTTRKRRRKESQDEWLKRAFTKIEGLVANLTITMTMTNTDRVTARYTKYVGHYIYSLYPLMNLFESCLWWPNPSMAARAVIDGPWWSESHENVKTCCNMAQQVEDAKACSTWQRRLSFSCIYVPCT